MFPELKRLIEQLGKEKGINKQIIINALETAMLSAAKKKFGLFSHIEAIYNQDIGEIEVFQFKTVVNKITNYETQITIDSAKQNFDDEAQLDDLLGIKIDTTTLGRIAVQTAKQIIIQKIKDAERDNIFEEFKHKKNNIINGFVQRFDSNNMIINLGKTEGLMPFSEQVHQETFKRGDYIKAYVCDVKKITKGPQIILSRIHSNFLKKLFEIEIPEIAEDIIQIVSIAREPGYRSKIAVFSTDKDVDPVGACVGMRGSRVQNIVQELKGERVDIVLYSKDPVIFVCNAIAPANVEKVLIYNESHSIEIIVPENQLSLAIGKNGQNVRLAARLTGWKIDIKTKTIVDSVITSNDDRSSNYKEFLKLNEVNKNIV